jgi:hypothetical protein
VRAARTFIVRTVRATALLARDRRVPKPVRALVALGLLPIPGPVDEALLLVLAPFLYIFYREPMREAWRQASRPLRSQ